MPNRKFNLRVARLYFESLIGIREDRDIIIAILERNTESLKTFIDDESNKDKAVIISTIDNGTIFALSNFDEHNTTFDGMYDGDSIIFDTEECAQKILEQMNASGIESNAIVEKAIDFFEYCIKINSESIGDIE